MKSVNFSSVFGANKFYVTIIIEAGKKISKEKSELSLAPSELVIFSLQFLTMAKQIWFVLLGNVLKKERKAISNDSINNKPNGDMVFPNVGVLPVAELKCNNINKIWLGKF